MPAKKRAAKRIKPKTLKKMRDRSAEHKKNIRNEKALDKSSLEPGMIVRFNYRGLDVHEPRPLVLILNPKWKNHLHGLALRVMSEAELLKLAKMVKVTMVQKLAKKHKFFPKLGASIGNPEKFYKNKIKRFNKNLNENAYRKYTRKGITGVKAIDYKFKDMDPKISEKVSKNEKR